MCALITIQLVVLEHSTKALGILLQVAADTFTEVGDPKEVICEALEKLNIQLLVLGSHGRKALQRLVFILKCLNLLSHSKDLLTTFCNSLLSNRRNTWEPASGGSYTTCWHKTHSLLLFFFNLYIIILIDFFSFSL